MTEAGMPFTLEQLEFLRGILSGIVKEASQANKGQRLAAIQSDEVLLQAIHDVSTELSGVVGVLIKKGLVTSSELEQQERENAAQLEVEKAHPELRRLFEKLKGLQSQVQDLKRELGQDQEADEPSAIDAR
jgi:hypothetical protein